VLQQSQRLRRELNSHERGFAASQGSSAGTVPAHDSAKPYVRSPGSVPRLRAQSKLVGLDTKRSSRRSALPRQRAAGAQAISQLVGPPQRPHRVPLGDAYQADRSESPPPRRLEDTWPHRFLRGAARACRSARGGYCLVSGSQSADTPPPNPSLERRHTEAGHLGAAQGSRRLHCPARRQGGLPRWSPQLER
jgi:hypothetical protein